MLISPDWCTEVGDIAFFQLSPSHNKLVRKDTGGKNNNTHTDIYYVKKKISRIVHILGGTYVLMEDDSAEKKNVFRAFNDVKVYRQSLFFNVSYFNPN